MRLLILMVIIPLYYAVKAFITIVHTVMDIRKRYKRAMPWLSNEFQEWQEDQEKLREWHRRYPTGPETTEECDELEDLRLYEIGSYVIYRHSLNKSFLDGYGNEQLLKLDRWEW